MNDNLKDILANLQAGMNDETLLKYLQGHLSAEEQHEVEKALVDDDFEADAVDGLQHLQNTQQIPTLVEQLNRELKRKMARKKKWRLQRQVKLEPWLLLTIVLILLLAIIGFVLIHRMPK